MKQESSPERSSSAVLDLATLEARLSDLPPPAAGRTRVYRGQTANFPAMLPSSCRPGAPTTGKVWDIALLGVRSQGLGVKTEASAMETLMNVGFWFKVLAQHYGPGSPYLDITTSPEVALWFALNSAGSGNPEQPFHVSLPGIGDVPVQCSLLAFSPHREVAWFYVLDVPVWDGEGVPGHGQLLDLSLGPEFVASCPRVGRQHGGLVLGDIEVDGGDLSSFYACPPIAVARDFGGTDFIDREPEHLFPAPEEDEWFRRLLLAPLVPQPGQPESGNGFEYGQSLATYVVVSRGDAARAQATLEIQLERMAPPVRGSLRTLPELRRKLRDATQTDPDTATYVQLAVPLLFNLPPPENWNQSVLASGLSRRARPRVVGSDELLPAVTLENVLIELSPLEYSLGDPNDDVVPLQAVWVLRRGHEYRFTAFASSWKTGALGLSEVLAIEFSPERGRFERVLDSGRAPLVEAALPLQVKAFFVALAALRELSSELALDPYSSISTEHDGRRVHLLPLRGTSTVLTRARADPGDVRLHFLRYADSSEPYGGPRLELPAEGLLKIETAVPYAALSSLRDVYGHARELVLDGVELGLPEPENRGFSQERAEFLLAHFASEAETRNPGAQT